MSRATTVHRSPRAAEHDRGMTWQRSPAANGIAPSAITGVSAQAALPFSRSAWSRTAGSQDCRQREANGGKFMLASITAAMISAGRGRSGDSRAADARVAAKLQATLPSGPPMSKAGHHQAEDDAEDDCWALPRELRLSLSWSISHPIGLPKTISMSSPAVTPVEAWMSNGISLR